uniref:Uncharacterized protein n=1 Tax=Magallana gigas TaxID=29159 RepID=K1QP16_MAGGI
MGLVSNLMERTTLTTKKVANINGDKRFNEVKQLDNYFCDEGLDEVCSDIHYDIIHDNEYCCHDNKQPCPSEWSVGWFGSCCILL